MPPAAVAIGLGLTGAATSLFGAKKASDAATHAADVQAAAAAKAQEFNQRVYDDSTQRLTPYVTSGAQSLAALQARYGASDPAALSARANAFTNAARYGGPASFGPGPTQAQYNAAPMAQPGGGRMPERGPELPQGGPPMSLAAMQAGGGQPPPMVTVQDDTGARRQVPATQAPMYQQRGFKVIG